MKNKNHLEPDECIESIEQQNSKKQKTRKEKFAFYFNEMNNIYLYFR